MDWKMLLACVTGSVDEELLLRNEYIVTENRILHKLIEGCVQLTDTERQTLAEIGKKLTKKPSKTSHHCQTRYPPRLASQARGTNI
jgi:putative transposase